MCVELGLSLRTLANDANFEDSMNVEFCIPKVYNQEVFGNVGIKLLQTLLPTY